MTREERNTKLKAFITCLKCETSGKCCNDNCTTQYEAGNTGEIIENLEEISKILEQETCDDCVSRKDIYFKLTNGAYPNENIEQFIDRQVKELKDLPPLTPTCKTGHWVEKITEDGCCELYSYWVCSECGRTVGHNLANIEDVLNDYPYCHCGAKMIKPQERSNKNDKG